MIQPQILINDRYLLGIALEPGLGSEVFRGEDQVLKRPVTIKLVKPAYVDAYRAALGATTHIGHPAFVGVFDSLLFGDRLAIIQEWITGQRFADLARADLSPLAIARLGRHIALALAHAHRQGVVHGDLTPAAIFRDQWGAVRINDVLLPPDATYFAAAGHILSAGAEPWDVTTPGIRDDLRATGILLWLLLARRLDIPTEATGMSTDWQLVGREVPEVLRDCIERLLDPAHPRAIDSAEAAINVLSGCIRTLDPRAPSRSLPPWEASQPGAVVTNPPLSIVQPSPLASPVIAAEPPAPMVIGPTPTPASDADVTWANNEALHAVAHANVRHEDPAISVTPTKPARDYALWVVLGVALFLFWLIVGFAIRGLF